MLACLSTVDSFSLSGVRPNVAESLCEWQECFLYSAGNKTPTGACGRLGAHNVLWLHGDDEMTPLIHSYNI